MYGDVHYYKKNLQGDIIALTRGGSDIVARYSYDAWGKCTVYDSTGQVNTSADFIGNINPYRYRGYYFDTESGFYYLQSRYYDPNIGRFINADEACYTIVDKNVACCNLFAYCYNDNINREDSLGLLGSDISKYTVAIAVQTPNDINSTVAFNFNNLSAGHAFVMLYKDNYSSPIIRGFRSKSQETMKIVLSRKTVEGLIKDEATSSYDAIVYYPISQLQYNIIHNHLYSERVPNYNIVEYNCVTFALEALNKAGIRHNFKKSYWNLGAVRFITRLLLFNISYSILSKIVGGFALTFEFSYGYYPAKLAYDIHRGIR